MLVEIKAVSSLRGIPSSRKHIICTIGERGDMVTLGNALIDPKRWPNKSDTRNSNHIGEVVFKDGSFIAAVRWGRTFHAMVADDVDTPREYFEKCLKQLDVPPDETLALVVEEGNSDMYCLMDVFARSDRRVAVYIF